MIVAQIACTSPRVKDHFSIEAYDPLLLVDPLIGTGGLAGAVIGLNPGAAVPFGLTQTGPDTVSESGSALSFYHFGGYHYPDTHIAGFAHEHANGMGINDFGQMMIMPRAAWSDAFATHAGRIAGFTHDTEEARPGYYGVRLEDDGTEVAIAATENGAIHRYRFSADAEPVVILDLGHAIGEVTIGEANLSVDLAAATVDAFQRLHGAYSSRFGGMQTWAHLVFEPTPVSGGTWTASAAPEAGVLRAAGEGDVGGWVGFAPGTTEVTVRVSLSHVDSDGARMNHEAQLADRDFVAVEGEAEAAWSALLGGVRVQGGTEEQRVIFHTAMYHAALWPNRFQDVDGRYRGVDGEVHTADFDYHSNFSMWDTFRTTHPWFMLTQPETQADMARSLVRMVRDGGHMPRWALGHGYTGGMVGTPAAQILAGTALKGITGWDQDLAFDACFRHSTEATAEASRGGIADYLALGYVPIETSGGSASLGVEYSWNDHALWRWAEQLGRTREAAVLSEQQHNWQNHWDPSQGFIVGRYADGQFRALGNPVNWLEDYVEGNAWHYLWPAPYDVEAMVALQHDGDTDAFVAALDTYWAKVETEPDDAFPDDYYWHGNEPDLHHAWLGALVGHPEATQGPVRHIMETRYSAEPDGLDGNDDAGTLSSWYLFAAMGLYPVAGTPNYAIAGPIFEHVEIDRPDGTLVIEAPGVEASPDTPTQVKMGGEPLDGWTVDHADLVAAGGLVFEY